VGASNQPATTIVPGSLSSVIRKGRVAHKPGFVAGGPDPQCTDFAASYGKSSKAKTPARTARAQPFID